jgi:4,5-DOPA dioxygenase extradiol
VTLSPIFISHGAPTLAIEEVPARHFLMTLGDTAPRPRAILVASAHWETRVPTVSSVKTNATIHDFRGFPEQLYRLRYPAPGDPDLAVRIADLLAMGGFEAEVDCGRGLDHGAWVPLILAYPQADIPVLQLSVQPDAGPEHHLRIGRALAPLTHEGVLVLGSGSFTHDLSTLRFGSHQGAEPQWVGAFANWMDAAIASNRADELIAYRTLAPFAARNHPTEEHLLPLFVALGAAGEGASAERLHRSLSHGVLRMDAYRFAPAQDRSSAAAAKASSLA